ELRSIPGIFPAYHMNRKHWITVVLDDTLADEEVARLIETSFELTS
ncbi:MAG: MmcQ/YjbR family DNA-binding protein, partial [Coriobacteriales bacterium]|nr:MmcQ/YjbR family DNA-binding protein [Coriobacteriales bacterium]